jgi:DNA-binding Lrp family transcriptional regulator
VSDLPAASGVDRLDARVLAAIERASFTSQEALREALGCGKGPLLASLARLESAGRIHPKSSREAYRVADGGVS